MAVAHLAPRLSCGRLRVAVRRARGGPRPAAGRGRRRGAAAVGIAEEAGGGQQGAWGARARRAGELARALVSFSRPHTIVGTTASVVSVSAMGLGAVSDVGTAALLGMLQALVPALLMNVCIVGLNQLYDVKVDRINKPYLPLASGAFSMRTGVAIVAGSGAAALALGAASGSAPLLGTLVASLALGVAYSTDLPLLRWKRSPVLAAACILIVRALAVQLGFFLHMRVSVLGGAVAFPPQLLFATGFMCAYSVVIALFKDIPDSDGDERNGIRTLTVRVGRRTVFNTCVGVLLAAYAAAVAVGAASPVLWSAAVTVAAHGALAAVFWAESRAVDLDSTSSIFAFYMFVWKLFYAEYALLPLLRFG